MEAKRRCQRPTRRAHSSLASDNTARRQRASSFRFESWVEVAFRPLLPLVPAPADETVELVDTAAGPVRVASHFRMTEEAVITVGRGVLHALRHHGTRELLPAAGHAEPSAPVAPTLQEPVRHQLDRPLHLLVGLRRHRAGRRRVGSWRHRRVTAGPRRDTSGRRPGESVSSATARRTSVTRQVVPGVLRVEGRERQPRHPVELGHEGPLQHLALCPPPPARRSWRVRR